VVDLLITDLAVFAIDKHGSDGLTLIETAPGVSVEEIRAKTEPDFKLGGARAA
jgi:3-oxoacid CoA-transferase subunit B